MEVDVLRLGEAAHDVGAVLERCHECVTQQGRELREECDAHVVAVHDEMVVALARDDRADEAPAVGRVGACALFVRVTVERDLGIRHASI